MAIRSEIKICCAGYRANGKTSMQKKNDEEEELAEQPSVLWRTRKTRISYCILQKQFV